MKFLKKRVATKKIKNAFQIAEICYTSKWNNKTLRQFPHILDIRFNEDKTVYVFRLPHGVDPKSVQKKDFVFRSIFGDQIEFKGDSVMSFTVYKNVHNKSYPYDFEDMRKAMSKHRLPIVAGKDVNGKFHCYDMTTNPHLLIAGETGSGKSVMLRSILTSLIQHFRHGGLQLHLADLKRSEFHLFRNVDIVNSVMTDKKDVKACVAWFHQQLKIRGDLLDNHELSHIDELTTPLDYLVLCIDEFSILREEKKTLEQLADLTALGRALGVYVILSTQRPDRKVVDGLMKANLTVRYAFRHADKINSRITLGEGAKEDASQIDEKDKGKFYMRFSGCKYIQSPLLEVDEAKNILSEFKTPTARNKDNEDIVDYDGEVKEVKDDNLIVLGGLEEDEE